MLKFRDKIHAGQPSKENAQSVGILENLDKVEWGHSNLFPQPFKVSNIINEL